MLVAAVVAGSVAEITGQVRLGDVILEVNGSHLETLEMAVDVMGSLSGDISLQVLRVHDKDALQEHLRQVFEMAQERLFQLEARELVLKHTQTSSSLEDERSPDSLISSAKSEQLASEKARAISLATLNALGALVQATEDASAECGDAVDDGVGVFAVRDESFGREQDGSCKCGSASFSHEHRVDADLIGAVGVSRRPGAAMRHANAVRELEVNILKSDSGCLPPTLGAANYSECAPMPTRASANAPAVDEHNVYGAQLTFVLAQLNLMSEFDLGDSVEV